MNAHRLQFGTESIVWRILVKEEKFGIIIKSNASVQKEQFLIMDSVFLLKLAVIMEKFGIQKHLNVNAQKENGLTVKNVSILPNVKETKYINL